MAAKVLYRFDPADNDKDRLILLDVTRIRLNRDELREDTLLKRNDSALIRPVHSHLLC